MIYRKKIVRKIISLLLFSLSVLVFSCNFDTGENTIKSKAEDNYVESISLISESKHDGDFLFVDGELIELTVDTQRFIFENDPDYPDIGSHTWKILAEDSNHITYYCTKCGALYIKTKTSSRNIEMAEIDELLSLIPSEYLNEDGSIHIKFNKDVPPGGLSKYSLDMTPSSRGVLAGTCDAGGEHNWIRMGIDMRTNPVTGLPQPYQWWKCTKCGDWFGQPL